MESFTSYPKVYNLGHSAIKQLLNDPVLVEEKIDGSQFSFGRFTDPVTGEEVLKCRSRGAVINVDYPEKMFAPAVAAVKDRFPHLVLGWTYRGEFVGKRKHNVLFYDRVPKDGIIIFDVATGQEEYVTDYYTKRSIIKELDFECVPLLYEGQLKGEKGLEELRSLLKNDSVLGGQKVEGVVLKNYLRFGVDGKPLFGKYVSEAFKEKHGPEWKAANPGQKDIIQFLIKQYQTPARWSKAVQHLRERGELTNSPKDIGPLMEEVHQDLEAEEKEAIKEALWKFAGHKIKRGIVSGLPEWYKQELMRNQFEG